MNMRRYCLVSAAVVLLGVPSGLLAGGTDTPDANSASRRHLKSTTVAATAPVKKAGTSPTPVAVGRPQYRILTGSHIPQRYNEYGYITDSSLPVTVLERDDIGHLDGRPTVGAVLSQIPSVTILGGH